MPRYRHDQARTENVRIVPPPTGVLTWFIFDLLALLLVAAGIYSGIFAFYSPPTRPAPTPLDLFTGNAVLLVLAGSTLAFAVTMTVLHVTYAVHRAGEVREGAEFVLEGVVGLILVLAIATAIGYTMYAFYSKSAPSSAWIPASLAVQTILCVVTLFYSSMLKSHLMTRLYEFTAHAGIARLAELNARGEFSDRDNQWLRRIRGRLAAELDEFDCQYRELQTHLGEASGSEVDQGTRVESP